MRAFTALTLLASVLGLASATPLLTRQEAVRFGIVNVSPSVVKLGEEFTVTYNSTLARRQPKFLDVYIQGQLPSGFIQPQYLLRRSDFDPANKVVSFNTTLPIIARGSTDEGYSSDASYLVWAFVTFPVDNEADSALTYGGTSTSIGIDFN